MSRRPSCRRLNALGVEVARRWLCETSSACDAEDKSLDFEPYRSDYDSITREVAVFLTLQIVRFTPSKRTFTGAITTSTLCQQQTYKSSRSVCITYNTAFAHFIMPPGNSA